MGQAAFRVRNFSHVCVAVSDAERSLGFYRDVLGLEPLFDVRLEGPSLEAVTGEAGARGRMVGLRVPGNGVTIELLEFGHAARSARGGPGLGYTNISLSVNDLDAAWQALVDRGLPPVQKPVEIEGVRMFFVVDPDGTPIEIIEFPRGATTTAQHRGGA